MNTTILQKCVDELKKDTPNISYVLGMLETVIDMNGNVVTSPHYHSPQPQISNIVNVPYVLTDEERLAQTYAGGPVGSI